MPINNHWVRLQTVKDSISLLYSELKSYLDVRTKYVGGLQGMAVNLTKKNIIIGTVQPSSTNDDII